jgi:hypothetical protein
MGSPDQDCSSYCNRYDAPGHGRPKYWVSKHIEVPMHGDDRCGIAPETTGPLGAHPSGACRCTGTLEGVPANGPPTFWRGKLKPFIWLALSET